MSAGLPEGIQTFQAKLDQWRLFIRTLPTGDRLVVGQRTDDRDELARNAGLRTVFPLIFLIPVLLILINVLIRHMLRPITRLATELDQRHDTDLQSLDERGVPDEIKPFIASINRLLLRVDKSMEIQRRFVADAAHELRSPLTALTLQAENLAKIALPPAADERLTALRSGLHRMHSLLEQLLTMARSQTPLPVPITAIPVADMFRRVLENMMPMAEQKNLNIEVEADPDALFRGHEFDGMTLIKNLIDNAIRYTPSGGKITLRAQQQGTTLSVEIEDTGPGIPAAEQDRIFDPFYRIPGSGEVGSGLGLAIIKTILKRMGATISLLNLVNPSSEIEGFRFTVLFHHQ
ncbi:ATP-binding protein [Herbaspirillum sp. RTI4]|uniref:ATP-binding protein n=1 Tax=Herbaspirillum sp. RTI4 TaxID=3048640 RepID=UPI002AB58921|nr:ATP-binding protein [Herbaspirillum sp. RTI4]MDY7580109.1 ATP-binding protein [Herbaspirillum sp. RTI4]MEA9983110.1 ATP-binding protein [Herbaspirillum sp. RTI4]